MFIDVSHNTPEWLDARRGRVNASSVGAALGVSPFTSRKQAIKRMVSDTLGLSKEIDAPPLRWGHEHEEEAVKLWGFLYNDGLDVAPGGYWYDTIGEIELGASPDRLVGVDGLLEVKCPYSLRDITVPKFSPIAELEHYYHQVQVQLLLTGREWCGFFQWAPNGHSYEVVERDPEWIHNHAAPLRDFYADYQAALSAARSGGPQEKVALSARWLAAAETFLIYKRNKESAEASMNDARKVLEELCKEAGIEECSGAGVCMQRVLRVGSVDYKAIAVELAGDKEVERRESTHRRAGSTYWRLTEEKGDD